MSLLATLRFAVSNEMTECLCQAESVNFLRAQLNMCLKKGNAKVMRFKKIVALASIMFSVTVHAGESGDLVSIIGAIGGFATAGQTIQSVNKGAMSPLDAAQVAAGGVNAYVNDPKAGQVALGGVSVARVLAGQAGGAVDPTYDAVGRIGSVIGSNGPNNASTASAVLNAAGSLGIYSPRRAVNDVNFQAPVINHPALAPRY